VHQEVEELRPKLKEVLYDCAVEIRATKAALYLFDGTSKFELITEYGFRGGVRNAADFNDALVDRCMRARTPFFVNGLAAEPRLSEILYEASTDRLLAAPIFSRGKLIGIVDMRDKAAKQPFEQPDVPKAQQIADRFVQLLADKAIFGHRFIALSKLTGQHEAAGSEPGAQAISAEPPVREMPNVPPPAAPAAPKAAPPIVVQPPPAAPAPAPQQQQQQQPAARSHTPRLASLVIEARSAASRIVVAPTTESMSETELSAAREVLRSILLIPGAVAVMLSAYGHMGGVQEIAARSTLADDAKNLIQSKLNVWLTKRGEAGGFIRTSVVTPFGTSAPPVQAADVQKVFTAPVNVGTLRGIYLTVVFGRDLDRLAHDLLAVMHSHLQLVIEQSMSRGTVGSLHARIAEKLLEPDFAKYPELRRHTDAVVKLAESLARHLNLSPAEVEQVRIVALVHDVGMRLLDYDRLYRKRDLTQEEMGFLREHPVVGAAIVEPLLGNDIARAVLCHHERYDGRGYPNELAGEEIPMSSRIVQICDAWVAITDPESYQPPQTPDAALSTIARAAGGQFDPNYVKTFVEMVRRS
jgi:hypothetical protein